MTRGPLITIWAALLVGLWFACGGRAPESDEPIAFTTVEYEPIAAAPEQTAPQAQSPAACPPCPTTAPALPLEEPQCSCLPRSDHDISLNRSNILNIRAAPEGVRGWYCFELRRKRGDKDYQGTCRRTRELCEGARKSVLHLKGHVTPCAYRDKATCFHYENSLERELYAFCYVDYMQCMSAWGDTNELNRKHVRLGRMSTPPGRQHRPHPQPCTRRQVRLCGLRRAARITASDGTPPLSP